MFNAGMFVTIIAAGLVLMLLWSYRSAIGWLVIVGGGGLYFGAQTDPAVGTRRNGRSACAPTGVCLKRSLVARRSTGRR